MRHPLRYCALGLALALCAGTASATDATRAFQDFPGEVLTDGFLEAHLDLFYRKAGIAADRRGDFADARKKYQLAARYADKPSQARLGELYWEGQGGEADRVMGFLWMALAAERNYEAFAAVKMSYWNQLTPAERKRAVALDKQMLGEYGDAVAKPRQARVMRREAQRGTGGLLGYSSGSALSINLPGGGGIDPEVFYAKEFWEPEAYWQMQDYVWDGRSPGRVDIGDVQNLGAQPASDAKPKDEDP